MGAVRSGWDGQLKMQRTNTRLEYMRQAVAGVGATYANLPETRAAMSVGSVAYGEVDRFSDIDLVVLYQTLPSEEALDAARAANHGDAITWEAGDREKGEQMQAYGISGIECQVVHSTLEAWERTINIVLKDHVVDTPAHKALSGLLAGKALYGADLIEEYKARAKNFPDPLAIAMATHYLQFQAIWKVEERLRSRDAEIWLRGALVEGAQHLLGVLAAVNRLYYTQFQFKQMRWFVDSMPLKPDRLYERLNSMLLAADACAVFRDLTEDVTELVEAHMPAVSTASIRRKLEAKDEGWDVPVS